MRSLAFNVKYGSTSWGVVARAAVWGEVSANLPALRYEVRGPEEQRKYIEDVAAIEYESLAERLVATEVDARNWDRCGQERLLLIAEFTLQNCVSDGLRASLAEKLDP